MKFSDKHKQFAIKSYAHQNLQHHSQKISVNHNQHYSLVGVVSNHDFFLNIGKQGEEDTLFCSTIF